MTERCYLDWNAGTPLLPEVRSAIAALLGRGVGNASSVHAEGRAARALIEEARGEVAVLIGAEPGSVIFTSGGSEANAAAIHGVMCSGAGPAGKVMVLARVEHPSVIAIADQLQSQGAGVRWVPVARDGVVDATQLDELLAAEPVAMVCLQLANSETGVVQPVAALAARARAAGAIVHCDAVQAAGKLPVEIGRLGVDLLALSAHKLGGLPGAGALVDLGTTRLEPLIPGVHERYRRGGTENLAGVVAFGAAARVARASRDAWQAVAQLRDQLESEVGVRVGGCRVYGLGAGRLPNTSCLGMPAPASGGVMVAALDLRGFAVSSGTACSSGVERGSVVIEAMGFGRDAARRTVRVSLGPATASDDVRRFVDALASAVVVGKGGEP
jgi:cysteine desulfurase